MIANVYGLPGKYEVSGGAAGDQTEICSYLKEKKYLHTLNVAVDI